MASTLAVDTIKSTSGGADTFTLPTSDGTAGQVLQTNASGVLSFTDPDPNAGKGSNISSADPLVIAAGSNYFIVTGTTGFNDMTVAANTHFFLEFAGALVMTHVGGALDLPSAAAITTVAGDVGEFFATAANVVTCVNYTRADGSAVKIKDESINSDHYVDGSIDNVHLADDAVNSDELAAGSVDTAHIAVNQIDETLMKDAFIADFTEITVATGDSILLGDATSSGNTKRDTVAGIIDLVHGATVGAATMWIPALAMYGTTANAAAANLIVTTAPNRPELKVLDFDASNREYAQFSIAMPNSWNKSTITYQVYWSPSNTNTDDCIWALEAVAITDGDTADLDFGAQITSTDAGSGTIEDIQRSPESAALTVGGTPIDGDLLFFQIYRDAAGAHGTDDFTGDARLLGVKIFFTTDQENDA